MKQTITDKGTKVIIATNEELLKEYPNAFHPKVMSVAEENDLGCAFDSSGLAYFSENFVKNCGGIEEVILGLDKREDMPLNADDVAKGLRALK